jgi:uncharacterized protein YoxC
MAAWIPVTVALSLLVIALSFVAIALGVVASAKKAVDQMDELTKTLRALHTELGPALKSVTIAADSTEKVVQMIQREGEGVAETAQRVRTSVNAGLTRLEERMSDLDALYEVLYEEMKETGLEVGVTMRRLRRPGSWWGKVRRLIG